MSEKTDDENQRPTAPLPVGCTGPTQMIATPPPAHPNTPPPPTPTTPPPHTHTPQFFFKQKTAYEILRRDWSSDVCSSD
eukprot:COSAG01_NODE_8027_length_2949_cov_69.698947_5_plen_78_part_01